MLLNRVKIFLLDLFLPKKCLGCNQPDTYLCRACFNKIEILLNNTCFFCGKITWQGKICLGCQKETYLDRIISATEYKKPIIRELIKSFKYHYVKELSQPLSQLLIKILENISEFKVYSSGFIVIPVPLYKRRHRQRGFNQAELLAKEVANHFNLSLENNILKRGIPSIPQAKIRDINKRKTNLKEVFSINPSFLERIQDANIILIDDVCTTGATLVEAVKILKKSGAKEVWALVVAKG